MLVELNNYNLDECVGILLKHYISEQPRYTMRQLALDFGVSERTVYRWLKKYYIAPKQRKFEDQAIGYLISKGFKISKDESNSGD